MTWGELRSNAKNGWKQCLKYGSREDGQDCSQQPVENCAGNHVVRKGMGSLAEEHALEAQLPLLTIQEPIIWVSGLLGICGVCIIRAFEWHTVLHVWPSGLVLLPFGPTNKYFFPEIAQQPSHWVTCGGVPGFVFLVHEGLVSGLWDPHYMTYDMLL